jgi:hypothetical protein
MTTRVTDLFLSGIHSAIPAAGSTPVGALYSCTTHGLIYKNNGSTWPTWATVSGGSIAASGVTFSPTGAIAATDVQAALAEVDSEKQPLDSDLTAIAGLTATTDNVIQSVAGAWASRTPAQVKAALVIAESDVTGLVADLAAKVPKSLFDANTMLYATTDDTPVALTVAASRIVGRKASGDIAAMTAAELWALLAAGTGHPEVLMVALSDESTAITTGTAKVTMRMPFAFTLTAVRASLTVASSSGIPTVDINEGGTTILSTKLTIDASELTSTTAAAAAVISDANLADDAEITFDVDVAGTGAKGLKVCLIGTRA